MEILEIEIKKIKPYKKNAKKHPQEQIDQIKESIELFGFNDPIGIWGDKNEIIEGHGRFEACKQLGFKKVPCIRLDHLTDEERKAYVIVHNKLNMNTDFDYDILNEELEDIFSIDMEQFGFEFFDVEEEHEKHKEKTQERVANILNLEIAQYEGVGKYDIPQIEPVYELGEIKEWIGFNYVLSDDDPTGKAVHFFIDDYQFMRLWNDPQKYVEKLKQYVCVTSPDFSPYGDMPMATQIYNHYRKHWVARYLQSQGVTVIPTIRASTDERSFEWYLDGEPKNSIVCISSMWASKEDVKKIFLKEFNTMKEELKPLKIFVYGNEVEELSGNIEYIESFTRKRWGD